MKIAIILFLLINVITAIISMRMLYKKLNPPIEPMCDSCERLRRKNPKKQGYWRFICEKRERGFDIAPEKCNQYCPKEG